MRSKLATILAIILMVGGAIWLGYGLYVAYPPLLHVYLAALVIRLGTFFAKE